MCVLLFATLSNKDYQAGGQIATISMKEGGRQIGFRNTCKDENVA